MGLTTMANEHEQGSFAEGVERQAHAESRDEQLARAVATKLSRGNISLQMGNFETEEQLEAARKSFENYEF
jgi:hypothetical protein